MVEEIIRLHTYSFRGGTEGNGVRTAWGFRPSKPEIILRETHQDAKQNTAGKNNRN